MDKGKAPLIEVGDGEHEYTRVQSELFCPFPSTDCDEDLVSMYFDVDKFSPFLDDLGLSRGVMSVTNAYSPPIQTLNSVKVFDEVFQSVSDRQKVKSDSRLVQADPLRVRRMVSNRQLAVKSRKKMHHIVELKEKVESIRREVATLSSNLSTLKQSNCALASENNKLKMKQHTLEGYIKLQIALNDSLQKQIRQLEDLMDIFQNGGQTMNSGSSSFSRSHQI